MKAINPADVSRWATPIADPDVRFWPDINCCQPVVRQQLSEARFETMAVSLAAAVRFAASAAMA
jgi:hypothetical protein